MTDGGRRRGFWSGALPLRAPALARNLLLAALVIGATLSGALAPLDRWICDHRFLLVTHPVGARIATVEIDSASLNEVGVWPWPRRLHGELVDRLMALGARRVLFDVDFSAESTAENDSAFADALRRANGRVFLASFQQRSGASGGVTINAATPALGRYARSVSVDVPIDSDGLVRDYFTALELGGTSVPTAGGLMAGRTAAGAGRFAIDYGLDIGGWARLSAADVFAGRAPRAMVQGRDVLVGSSAEELRDVFMTPRYGPLPGLAIHALAAESLLAGRALQPVSPLAIVALICALALLCAAAERRLDAPRVFLALAAAVGAFEVGALALLKYAGLIAPTVGLHAGLAAFAFGGMVSALRLRRRLHTEAARDRDATQAMLAQVVDDNFDGVIVIGDDGRLLGASQTARAFFGAAVEGDRLGALPDVFAEAVAAALAPSTPIGSSAGEADVAARDGSARRLEYVLTVSRASDRRVLCLTFRDVTERRAHVARLDYLARHDPMTGAWTRAELVTHLDAHPRDATVFSVALRRFDLVNDVFGHRVGDRMLVAVVERLRDLGFRSTARVGGAGFAFTEPGATAPADLAARCAALTASLARPYFIDWRPVTVGVSLGATTSALSGFDAATLLAHASMAEAAAARRIGDVFEVFSPELETRQRRKQAIDADLRRAVSDGSLAMHYQAKVDLKSGRTIGAEALMRWRTREGEIIPPSTFVPIAEESGLVAELGRFALRRACMEAAQWPEGGVVAVNLSPVQFGLSNVLADVKAALAAARLPADRLEVEITESAFAGGDDAIAVALQRLRDLGVAIALDDFGTGYSSLHYLGRLPIDTIKIDQSFVRAMHADAATAATVAAIVSLAKAHGKALVAEGIETPEDAARLAALGCEYGQGYLFGRPLEHAMFVSRLGADTRAA